MLKSCDHMLTPSLITSSSTLSLSNLMDEVGRHHPDTLLELFLLRDNDIDECFEADMSEATLASIVASGTFVEDFMKWIMKLVGSKNWRRNRHGIVSLVDWVTNLGRVREPRSYWFSGIATYFPGIVVCDGAGHDDSRQLRKDSIAALVNAIRIACRLYNANWMQQPVVEMVCGTVLDFCSCMQCQKMQADIRDRRQAMKQDSMQCFLVGNRSKKLDVLLDNLVEVCTTAEQHEECVGRPWSLALELEPGITYLLNGEASLEMLHQKLKKRGRASSKDAILKRHVGLNLDVAHYSIAGVPVGIIEKLRSIIIHGHICDTPGMHTRDLPVGKWTSASDPSSATRQMLEILSSEAQKQRSRSMPSMSRCVSLELEGCGRLDWVQQGLSNLSYLLRAIG